MERQSSEPDIGEDSQHPGSSVLTIVILANPQGYQCNIQFGSGSEASLKMMTVPPGPPTPADSSHPEPPFSAESQSPVGLHSKPSRPRQHTPVEQGGTRWLVWFVYALLSLIEILFDSS